jgi:hypothetical protein
VFNAPPNSNDQILFGIEGKNSVNELAQLYKSPYEILVAGTEVQIR